MAGRAQHPGDGFPGGDRAAVAWLWRALAAVVVAALPDPARLGRGRRGRDPVPAAAHRVQQHRRAHPVRCVPFVAAVLLISLGSDYNVFVVGRIFQEARRRPLRDAVALAVPRASRAITTAGLALAAGFGLLALVPLAQFREIAVAMALGIVLDTFVVRSLLVPALVVLFGRVGSWPGRTARPVRRSSGSPAAENLHRTAAYRD